MTAPWKKTYYLQMEDLWNKEWFSIGAPLRVEARTPEEALAKLAPPGLKTGVTYRIHIYRDGLTLRTEPAVFPARPTLAKVSA